MHTNKKDEPSYQHPLDEVSAWQQETVEALDNGETHPRAWNTWHKSRALLAMYLQTHGPDRYASYCAAVDVWLEAEVKALRFMPTSPPSRKDATLAEHRSAYNTALKAAEKYAEHDTKLSMGLQGRVLNGLGALLLHVWETEEARDCLDKALPLMSTHGDGSVHVPQVQFRLALAHMLLGDEKTARTVLSSAPVRLLAGHNITRHDIAALALHIFLQPNKSLHSRACRQAKKQGLNNLPEFHLLIGAAATKATNRRKFMGTLHKRLKGMAI